MIGKGRVSKPAFYVRFEIRPLQKKAAYQRSFFLLIARK